MCITGNAFLFFVFFSCFFYLSLTVLQVSANTDAEAVALNQGGDNKKDKPKSLGESLINDAPSSRNEVPAYDQTNVFQSLNYELPRHDQSSDAPNCNTEVPKPAAAESALYLSNHGMK